MKTLTSLLFLAVLFCATATSADRASATSLPQRVDQLEARVRGAEAVRAIKRLQYAYGHYAEFGLWNDLADLFSENGVGHYPSGTLGKEEIRKLFLKDIGKGALGLVEGQFYPHLMLQPVVTLNPDGRTAKGRWRVLAMLGSYGGTAAWAGGVYENEYILENGVWKIKDLHYYSRYTGRYEQQGWTADKGEIPLHYSPAQAGMPVPADLEIPSPAPAPKAEKIAARISDLSRRVRQLNELQEVENLQKIYGYYTDRKMWDQVADLFAADATLELGLQGVYIGKSSIRRGLNQFGNSGLREGELNDRLQLQIVADISDDGRTAKARSTELTMAGLNGEGAEWGEGTYESTFEKQNGVWRIKSVHFYPRLITDYDKGWAKDAKPAPAPSRDFPPDRPPTTVYSLFPKLYIPPFHFVNPVTGRAPQYPPGMDAQAKKASPKRADNSKKALRADELAERIEQTERMLKRALAYDATENLASAYGYYLDDFLWDETADLFTADGKRDFASISVENGREKIRASLKQRYPGKKSYDYLIVHQLIQPVIHVAQDGGSTQIRVRLFQLSGPSGGAGVWISGIYECGTVIENGTWKFSTMDLDYVWTADYKSGWARVLPNAKGVVSAPFPKIVEVPFHYSNPVTGRK